MMRVVDLQRGQALYETAIFIPLFLTLLYGILYFGQISVKQERVQTATRFGLSTLPSSDFTVESAYNTYTTYTSANKNVAMPALSPTPCPASATAQTSNAFNQAQTSPTSAPSAQPYWQMTSPTISCLITFLPVSKTNDMGNDGMSFINETNVRITGSVAASPYLTSFLPSSYAISGSFNDYLPATFDEQIACTMLGQFGGNINGFGMTLAQAFEPGTDITGQGQFPYYDGYNTFGYVNANKICNSG